MLRIALFLGAMTFALPAAAQPACAERNTVLDHLSAKYSEAPVALGLANNGGVIEVLTTNNGSTWTIIITMPNGKACMIAAGEGWQATEAERKVDPKA